MTSGDSLLRPADAMPRAVADHLGALGIHARPAWQVLALLADGWQPLAELIRRTTLPRRSVEELLTAAGDDLERDERRRSTARDVPPGTSERPEPHYRIRPARAARYRAAAEAGASGSGPSPLRFAVPRTPAAAAPTPESADAGDDALLAVIAADIAAGPPPTPAMDHVPADADTVLRRARWLDATYALDAARVLVLGDHDLTSLALCAVRPGVSVTVVDLDERVLAHIDAIAAARGYDIRCRHADLRFGLPPSVEGAADLVFSDPPYTPEGMALFAARAIGALRDPVSGGRLVLAYGYSDRSPALGAKVQQELLRLGLVFEAIVPGFHRYSGAHAVGSAADLYVCQPTARARTAPVARGTGIYTHGPQSIESTGTAAAAVTALHRVAGEGGERVDTREPGWARPVSAGAGRAVAVDLTADPGPWLLRTLLGINAERVAVLAPNNHPDLAGERGQRDLAELIGPKYRLRFLRSTPGPEHAIVVATAVPRPDTDVEGTGAAAQRVAAQLVLHRAHGKLGNVWREALIAASGGTLTKNAARDRIAARTPPRVDLDVRLIDLPRHQLVALLPAIGAAAAD